MDDNSGGKNMSKCLIIIIWFKSTFTEKETIMCSTMKKRIHEMIVVFLSIFMLPDLNPDLT